VPYVEPSRALILYLCWEQANLIGNHVILEKVEAREAIVRLRTGFFRLYKVSAHLGQQIPLKTTGRSEIWQDAPAPLAGFDRVR
jgi:hypothetical protein